MLYNFLIVCHDLNIHNICSCIANTYTGNVNCNAMQRLFA